MLLHVIVCFSYMFNIFKECYVCHDLPGFPIRIYQCKEGHIICKECFFNPNMNKDQCGMCRTDIEEPIRNRALESRLEEEEINCYVANCGQKMSYGDLVEKHISKECQWMIVDCKYKDYGCTWKGIRKQEKNHIHCNIDYSAILNQIQTLKDENKSLHQQLKNYNNNQAQSAQDKMFKSIIKQSQLIGVWSFNIEKYFAVKEITQEFRSHNTNIKMNIMLQCSCDIELDFLQVKYRYNVQWNWSDAGILKVVLIFQDQQNKHNVVHQFLENVDGNNSYEAQGYEAFCELFCESIDVDYFLHNNTFFTIKAFVQID